MVSVPLRGLVVFGAVGHPPSRRHLGHSFRPLTGISGIRSFGPIMGWLKTVFRFRPLTGISGIRSREKAKTQFPHGRLFPSPYGD